jgi:hypothetical protein
VNKQKEMACISSSSFISIESDQRKIYQYERSPFTSVSMIALNYRATDRIKTLSKPKLRRDTTIRDGKILINSLFLNIFH